MGRMSVHDQECLGATALHKVLEESHKGLRVQLAGICSRPKLSTCGDGADDVDTLALSGRYDYGGVPLQTVGANPGADRIGTPPRPRRKSSRPIAWPSS